jgi:cell division septation protein DedD
MNSEINWTVINESTNIQVGAFKSYEEAREFAFKASKEQGKAFVIKDNQGNAISKVSLLLG